jgi:S-disulfanyl-L-cysteine oxidoreductase SoxD
MRTTSIVKALSLVAALSFAAVSAACGGEAAVPPATPAAPGAPTAPAAPGAAPATFAEQVAAGRKLFADNCAGCHGDSGEGSAKTPRVVGLDKGALPLAPAPTAKTRKVPFKTAADVGEWVSKNMPPGQGGSLKDWEYWAIMAFDLDANGVKSEKKLDAASAKEIVLHK